MRVRLSRDQQAARAAALRGCEQKLAAIGALARTTDCLPVFVDWSAFLGLLPDGQIVWVDHDDTPGHIEPVTDLTALSIFVARAAAVPGLHGLKPARPSGRADCEHCKGQGSIRVPGADMEIGCRCGGLGWLPLSPEELGVEA